MKTPEQRAQDIMRWAFDTPPDQPSGMRDRIAAAVRDALADADREALGAACPVADGRLERLRRQAAAMMYANEAADLLAALDYYRALAAALAREQGLDQQVRAAYAAGLREGKRRVVEVVQMLPAGERVAAGVIAAVLGDVSEEP